MTGRLRRNPLDQAGSSDGYRTAKGDEGWVMRAPPSLFVTSVLPVESRRERAAMHGRHALVSALLLLVVLPVPLAWVDRALGTTETGTVVSSQMHRSSKGGTSWTVGVQTPSGLYTEETHHMPTLNSEQPVRRGRFSSNLGEGPESTFHECLVGLAACSALALALWVQRLASINALPWFRRRGAKLIESAPGRLGVDATT